MPVICPKCGIACPDNARFCEVDGTPLSANVSKKAPTVTPASSGRCRCGAPAGAQQDGYCQECGRRWQEMTPASVTDPRDHLTITLSPTTGAVSDRGKRHSENQDDVHVSELSSGTLLIVCDGVSASAHAQEASRAATSTLGERVHQAVDAGMVLDEAFLTQAISAANDAVVALGVGVKLPEGQEPPESTLVTALITDQSVLLGWVGDSRAYWIDPESPSSSKVLTEDHSWLNDMVMSGTMTYAEARKSPLASALIRCLGATDDAESNASSVKTMTLPPGAGWILLCSDGLWNYAPEAVEIAELLKVAQTQGITDATDLAGYLVAWANQQGGKDNITVALYKKELR